MKKIGVGLALAMMASAVHAQTVPQRCELADEAAVGRVRETVTYLASDALEGREPGTAGDRATVEFLTRRLLTMRAEPVGTHLFVQGFTVPYGRSPTAATAVTLRRGAENRVLTEGRDFRVVTVSGEAWEGRASGAVAYAGHGLVSEPAHWNDYRALGDLRGKVVVMLSGPPVPTSAERREALRRAQVYGTLYGKVHYAREHGASAVIVIERDEHGLDAVPYLDESGRGIPMVRVSRDVGAWLLGVPVTSLTALDAEPQPMALPGVEASLVVETAARTVDTSNVLARFRGTSPNRETLGPIVIGAHRDHIGHGVRTSRTPGSMAIHNGADDNASGTSVLLEVASRLATQRAERDVVVAWFGAEELGLLGSRHLVQHPVPATEHTAAMLNLDMVGRLRDCRLFLEGRSTARGFAEVVRAANSPYQFDARPWEPSRGSWGSSDQQSFLDARIPALFFFTGLHDDYHSPTDDAPTLNYAGLASVAGFAEAVLRGVAALTEADLRFHR